MPYANNQGVKIYYEVEGQGPPLMMGHGGLGDMSVWKDYGYVDRLKEQYRVILMDSRGHGKSDKLYDSSQYGYQLMVTDVITLLDHLGIDKTHYWGWSLNGLTAFGLAKHHPERLRSLIIGGASPYASDEPNQPNELAELLRRGVKDGVEVIVEGVRAWSGGAIPPAAEARLRRMDPRAHVAVQEAWEVQPGIEDVLPTMTMSCLLYIGEYDEVEHCKEYIKQMPKASLFIVPGCTHSNTNLAVDLLVPRALEFLAADK